MSGQLCSHGLFGGITLERAREIHREAAGLSFAGRKIFHVTVDSPIPIGGVNATAFNFYAISVEYSPITLTGEKRQIGAAFADNLRAAESIDLRVTTLDSQDAMLKRWYYALSALAAPVDGTVNVPARFATRFVIRHGVVDEQNIPPDAFVDQALYRPAGLEMSMSRAESGKQELAMSFAQLDTFMPSEVLPWA